MKKRAYISVYDKDGIVEFAKQLKGYEIVSTGGTYTLLKENGIDAMEVSTLTGSPEMLSGKVKSLHPKVFAAILADAKEVSEFKIEPFDLVVVNLYPFEKVISQTDNIDEWVKNIDIGGVALLRAAAKNFQNVTVICEKADYDKIKTTEGQRRTLAVKAFAHTAHYDDLISKTLDENTIKKFTFEKIQDLRYGENPHQKAALYKSPSMVDYEVLWGKELSYNNIMDMAAVMNIVSEFYDVNAAAIVKHTAPCGVALGKTLFDAYIKAFDCDPVSAFGGIIGFSQKVDVEIAKHINSMFVEVIVAPDFEEKALEILKGKKNLRLVKINTPLKEYRLLMDEEVKITPFGTLIQFSNRKDLDKDTFKVVTKAKPTAEQIEDAIFAWKVVKHAKSNSIVIAKDFKTLAIGQGQTSRVAACEWAMDYACEGSKDAVLASDGFFPAIDNVHAAVQGRIGLIIQPGGSIKDKDVIAEADKYKVAMITTGIRHFKH